MIIKHPFNSGRVVHVDKFDRDEVIIPNSSTATINKEMKDMPYVEQLTQNSWNMSSKTRNDLYSDVTIIKPKVVGRIERGRLVQVPGKYHENY